MPALPSLNYQLFPRRKTIHDVPRNLLVRMSVKTYLLGALAWDYADTVLDIAAQMRIGGPTKKLSRSVRALRADYDRIRAKDLDDDFLKREWQLAETFENINKNHINKLCFGLVNEIHRDTRLDPDYVALVEAVQMAMTILDTMRLFARQCDEQIVKYYPGAPHSILPNHFISLSILLPQFAGDCYSHHSQSRQITARILLNEINEIELDE